MLKNNPICHARNIVADVKEQKSADDDTVFPISVIVQLYGNFNNIKQDAPRFTCKKEYILILLLRHRGKTMTYETRTIFNDGRCLLFNRLQHVTNKG